MFLRRVTIDQFLFFISYTRYWRLLYTIKLLTSSTPNYQSPNLGLSRTFSQLLLSYTEVFHSFDNKQYTDKVFLDFAKVFDSISHNELLFKLSRSWVLLVHYGYF